MSILLMALAILNLTAIRAERPPSESEQCQVWADSAWVAEVGVKEHELRSQGCRNVSGDTWERDTSTCGSRAFRFARAGTVGVALVEMMESRTRCVRGADGGWVS